jgi:hypothetical protein
VHADGVFQRLAALRQLDASPRSRFEDEQWMRESVVADRVAGSGDGAGDLGSLAHEAANHEEGSFDVVPREDFQ